MKLTDSKIQIDIATAGIKKCKKCDEEYPATLGYFYQAKGNTGGLVHICKRCSDNKRHRKRIEELENTEISTELNGGIVDKLEDEKFSLKHEKGKLKSQNLFLKVLLFVIFVGLAIMFFTNIEVVHAAK